MREIAQGTRLAAGLERGLSLIEAFDDAHPLMTASQAGERCGMTRTPAHRYRLTLKHIVYIARNGSSRMMNTGYVLGTRVPVLQETARAIRNLI